MKTLTKPTKSFPKKEIAPVKRKNHPGRTSPNVHHLTVHFYNHERKNDFITTRSYKNVATYDEAILLIPDVSQVKVAYWNNRRIAKDGEFV